jgi:hypothetical protein
MVGFNDFRYDPQQAIEDYEQRQIERQQEAVIEELEDEKREAAWRFQEQCFLMLNWETFVRSNVRANGESKAYKNFCQIIHDKPYDYNNVLFRKSENADLLFQLNQAQLSLLVPDIRIYKEYKLPNGRDSVSIELPFDDLTRKDKIEQIQMTATGRGGGVGLKSFTWKSLGTNPSDKMAFGAEMVIHFQNLEDLFEVRDVKVLRALNSKPIAISFADLILQQKTFRKGSNEGSFVYDPEYFRIKVVCGWKKPAGIGLQILPKEVLDVIDQTKHIWYLTLKGHELDFRDDGTVDLTIDYNAYVDSLMFNQQNSNILFSSPEQEKLKKIYAEAIDKVENNIASKKRDAERVGSSQSTNPELDEDIKTQEELLEQYKEDFEKVQEASKEFAYQRIMSGLVLRGRIFKQSVSQEFFRKQLRVKNTTDKTFSPEDAKRTPEDTVQKNTETRQDVSQVDFRDVSELTKIAVGEFENDFGLLSLLSTELENLGANLKSLSSVQKKDFQGDKYNILFFYLGDLIEVVLDGMFNKKGAPPRTNFIDKELKIILGNLTFFDYGQIEDTGLVVKTAGLVNEKYEYERIYSGKRVSVNMADIPISLKVFTNWFIENITDEGLLNMSFKKFIEKIINDLLIRAVSTECREFAPRQKARMTYKAFSLPRSQKREALFAKALEQNKGFKISLEDMRDTQFKLSELKTNQEGASKIDNYLLIYSTAESPFDLKANVDEDRRRGIYHLFFGNEFGMVKSMRFKREDQPYLREANFANNLVDKKAPAKVLREKYNVVIEMYGNNLFEIGDKVHITPTIFGSGSILSRSKVLKDLGIGGYYDIIAVESRIESGKYVTTLDARWTARGDGTFNIGDEDIPKTSIQETKTKLAVPVRRVIR